VIEAVLLLSDLAIIPDLEAVLIVANPRLRLLCIDTLDALNALDACTLDKTRLISFGGALIVPAAVLNRLGGGAYNFHPGPPDRPGRYPSCFFIYDNGVEVDGDRPFGSTVHEMAARVDSGAIVATDLFHVPVNIDRLTLDALSFRSMFALFRRLAPALANDLAPLPRINAVWSGRATTQRDFEALCHLPQDVTEAEFQRRYRAVGEGPDHALNLTLFGHRFALDNRHAEQKVTVGGKTREPTV
jgi:methionyl-tRNA formyltransferase